MGITEILTKEGIEEDFMSWLWNTDRPIYTLILLGHTELITEELVEKYNKAESEGKE